MAFMTVFLCGEVRTLVVCEARCELYVYRIVDNKVRIRLDAQRRIVVVACFGEEVIEHVGKASAVLLRVWTRSQG